jgi:hypothetical protein
MIKTPSTIAPAMLIVAVLSTSAVKPVEYVRISPAAVGHRCSQASADRAGVHPAGVHFPGLPHAGATSSSGPSTPGRLTAGFAGAAERRSLGSGPHSDSASSASSRGSSQAC